MEEPQKAGGVRPVFNVKTTTIDGKELTGGETKKAITVNITNVSEYGDNYTIKVTDKNGSEINKIAVVGDLEGQASFIINKTGTYTITVTGKKDGKTKESTQNINIQVAMETTTEQFDKTYGVIDIVWLDLENNVIENPMSPKDYLAGLEPIKYDDKEKKDWVLADTDNPENEWYNYVAQEKAIDGKTSQWANARTKDKNAYFVWIPRYAYKITYFSSQSYATAYRNDRTSKNGIIGYSTIDGMISAKSGIEKLVEGSVPTNIDLTKKLTNTEYEEYIPHPGFEFGESKAGIWIAKYESSREDNTNIKFIPNAAFTVPLNVSDIFKACQDLKNKYKLDGETHLMKNTEWGAIAYLTDSKYGRNGKQVTMNTNNTYTGGGENDTYKTNVSQSTTGNIYGIYDMNGGEEEYVAGYINNNIVTSNGYNTNLINAVKKDKKYADVYPIDTDEDNSILHYEKWKGIKGDALYETTIKKDASSFLGWYKNIADLPETTTPIFMRGGGYGHTGTNTGERIAGIFAIDYHSGVGGYSFRVVL